MMREPAAAFTTAPAGFARTGQGLAVSALLHAGIVMALVAYGWGSGALQLDGEMVVALTWEGPQADAGGVVAAPIAPSAPDASSETPVSPPVPITDPVAPPEQAPETDALALAEPVPEPIVPPEADPVPEPAPAPEAEAAAEAEPLPEPLPEPEVAPEPETAPVEQAATVPPAPARPAAPPRPRSDAAGRPASAAPAANPGEARAVLSLPAGPGWSMADPDAKGGAGAPGDLQAPRLLSRTNPPYPPAARRQGREGVTTVSIELDDRGVVMDVRVLESSGYLDLDSAALAAVRAWRFSPALQAGMPIAARLDLAVRFDLDGTSPP
jgi:protein TonB